MAAHARQVTHGGAALNFEATPDKHSGSRFR
jgi:hypothetical protein